MLENLGSYPQRIRGHRRHFEGQRNIRQSNFEQNDFEKVKSGRKRVLNDQTTKIADKLSNENLQHSNSNSKFQQRNRRQSRSLSRNYSHRCIYVAEQASGKNQYMNNYRKDVQTIFHSPYKNGRKNLEYQNPSFLSNHLFYKHVIDENNLVKDKVSKSQAQIKKNIVMNRNDVEHQKLYEKRMDKSLSKSKSLIALANDQERQTKKQKVRVKTTLQGKANKTRNMPFDPAQKLKQQLQMLKSYKDHKDNTDIYLQDYSPRIAGNRELSPSILQNKLEPCYLNMKRIHKQDQVKMKQLQELRKWNRIGNQMKTFLKKENLRQKDIQERIVSKEIQIHRQKETKKANNSRLNADLLNQILLQQIQHKRIGKRKQIKQNSRIY